MISLKSSLVGLVTLVPPSLASADGCVEAINNHIATTNDVPSMMLRMLNQAEGMEGQYITQKLLEDYGKAAALPSDGSTSTPIEIVGPKRAELLDTMAAITLFRFDREFGATAILEREQVQALRKLQATHCDTD